MGIGQFHATPKAARHGRSTGKGATFSSKTATLPPVTSPFIAEWASLGVHSQTGQMDDAKDREIHMNIWCFDDISMISPRCLMCLGFLKDKRHIPHGISNCSRLVYAWLFQAALRAAHCRKNMLVLHSGRRLSICQALPNRLLRLKYLLI